MNLSNWTITAIKLLLSTVAGLAGGLIKLHLNQRRDEAEIEHLDAETIATLRTTVNELVKSVDDLRRRLYALESERERNRHVINGLRAWGRKLLAWLQAEGHKGWPEPEPGLLDTDPNINITLTKE